MNRIEASKFLISKLVEYGLRDERGNGWRGQFNPKLTRTLGRCNHAKKLIDLSAHYVDNNDETLVKDTILHEIAHALAGPNEGHGKVWKAWCIKIGAVPKAAWKSPSMGLVIKPKKYRLAIRHDDGRIEATAHTGNRLTVLTQSYLPKRKDETLGRLVWIENKG